MSILQPTAENIKSAARIIQSGGVIIMPTETVYGLACDALNDRAVQRVFEIKGRPDDNPLIVHIADVTELDRIAKFVPKVAKELASRFWPGPLTMVLEKRSDVPYRTTAGLETVAVRIPNHPVALALIRESERPLAAPSANPFTALSPTDVHDVEEHLLNQVEMALDGGRCEIGLESTVLDLSGDEPQILRPGLVSRADILAVLGKPFGASPPSNVRKSPGLYRRHYAPRAQVRIVDDLRDGEPGLTFDEPANPLQVKMPEDPRAYAAVLYSALKRLDDLGADEIAIVSPPPDAAWEAIHDRLRKASAV